jgi:hypothetical protein
MPSLFETRRRLPTFATALRRAGNQTRALRILAGTETSISFLFIHVTPSPSRGAVTCGEPRSVRSCQPQCWFFPLTQVCPAMMPPRTPHHRGLLLRCIVRIDVHGPLDRVKDASLCACDDLSCLRRVHTLYGSRACRRRSPPRRPPDIRCHRRACLQRRIPLHADGPT